MFSVLLLISLTTCAIMTGLVVFVNWVHYPAFMFIEKQKFIHFHRFHSTRTGIIAGIFMPIELISGLLIPLLAENNLILSLSLASAILVLYIWFETVFRVIPVHNKLSINPNNILIQLLVKTNNARTYSWILRLLLLLLIAIMIT